MSTIDVSVCVCEQWADQNMGKASKAPTITKMRKSPMADDPANACIDM